MVVACESALRDRFLSAIIDWWVYSYDVELYRKACQNEPWNAFAASMSLIHSITQQELALSAALAHRDAALASGATLPFIEVAHARLLAWLADRPAYSSFGEIGHLRYP